MVTPAEMEWSLRLASLAWAAGLFEGEGTAYRTVTNKRHSTVRMKISMTDQDVLEMFQGVVGGYLSPLKYRHKGAVEHGWKPQAQWMISSWSNFIRISTVFYPWLGQRRRAQIDAVLKVRPEAIQGERLCETDLSRPSRRGYDRHHRLGEAACLECTTTARLYFKLWARKKRANGSPASDR